MTTYFIDTAGCRRIAAAEQGEFSEIVNEALCGAKNVLGMLRWLDAGQHFDAEARDDSYQLIYLMDGAAVISLDGKEYEADKGMGVYLEPHETAALRQDGTGRLKLFHLVVPIRGE